MNLRLLARGVRAGSRLSARPRGGGHHRSACAAPFVFASPYAPVAPAATLSAVSVVRCVGAAEEGATPRARAPRADGRSTLAAAGTSGVAVAAGVGGDDDDGR